MMMASRFKITFFDFESTSQYPATAEILTGYFRTLLIEGDKYEFVDDLFINSKPRKYLEDSFAIHGITREESDTFEEPEVSLRKICGYLKRNLDGAFCCHANASIFGRRGIFDWTLIKTACTYHSDDAYWWFVKTFREAMVISTHTISKKILDEKKNDLGHLAEKYGYAYKKHDCKEDVMAMIHVYKMLTDNLDIQSYNDLIDLGSVDGVKSWTKNGLLI